MCIRYDTFNLKLAVLKVAYRIKNREIAEILQISERTVIKFFCDPGYVHYKEVLESEYKKVEAHYPLNPIMEKLL